MQSLTRDLRCRGSQASTMQCYRWALLMFLSSAVAAGGSSKAELAVSLTDGVIRYGLNGSAMKAIRHDRPCADLWVAPDGSMFTFISIERAEPSSGALLSSYSDAVIPPLILESAIYVASRVDGFLPRRLALVVPEVTGGKWRAYRNPKIAPDHSTVYFEVPLPQTAILMRADMLKGKAQVVARIAAYWIVWNGPEKGALILMLRHLSTAPDDGIQYPCVLVSGGRRRAEIVKDCFMPGQLERWAQGKGVQYK